MLLIERSIFMHFVVVLCWFGLDVSLGGETGKGVGEAIQPV
jgi:hypothetical protein